MADKVPSVLVVDDEPAHIEAIRRAFTAAGPQFTVQSAATLREYRELAAAEPPDIAVLDLILPDGCAVEALSSPAAANPFPILIMTSHGDEGRAVQAMKAGALDYIVKSPEAFADMPRAVERALREWKLIQGRKRAEEASRDSAAGLRALFEGVPLGVFLARDGKFLYVNPTYLCMTGFSKKDMETMTIFDQVAPEFREKVREHHRRCMGGIAKEASYEAVGLRKDGTCFPCHITATGLRLSDGPTVLAFIADITELKQADAEREKLQAQFRQSQKMEVVGRLAGGVAHDFNNILTAIFGNCTFLLADIPKDDPRHADVEEIRKAGDRAAGLTRQLLAFSRKQVMQLKTLNFNAVLTDMEKLLRRLIGEDVSLTVCGAKDLALVKADPGQMEQVVMNLAINARDAMPKGGRLTIETCNMELSGQQTLSHDLTLSPGRYALLTVSDTGTGMDAGTLEHIFEPFFTTKELGKGTGLGLATVFGIIKQSGGFIDVQSEPGHGTTFKIFLPAATAVFLEGEGEGEGEKKRRVAKSRHTILLIEDDETVRRMVCRILKSAGYAVLEAGSAWEALAHADKDFDLVLTDIVLPDLPGVELAVKIKKDRPQLEAIYMSGYTDNPDIRDILSRPENRFLQKPFTAKALLDKVQEALA